MRCNHIYIGFSTISKNIQTSAPSQSHPGLQPPALGHPAYCLWPFTANFKEILPKGSSWPSCPAAALPGRHRITAIEGLLLCSVLPVTRTPLITSLGTVRHWTSTTVQIGDLWLQSVAQLSRRNNGTSNGTSMIITGFFQTLKAFIDFFPQNCVMNDSAQLANGWKNPIPANVLR